MIDLEPGDSDCHDTIGNGMSFREHVFDLLAGIYIPGRYIMCQHLGFFIFSKTFTLTDMFHDVEGI